MSEQHVRCAAYTRKSSEEGLEQSFNSLEAQREACRAFVIAKSWRAATVQFLGNLAPAGLQP